MTQLCHSPSEKLVHHPESRSAESSIRHCTGTQSITWCWSRNSCACAVSHSHREESLFCALQSRHTNTQQTETVRQQHFFGTVWFLLDVNNWIERLNSYFGRLNPLLKLEGGGGPPICTQQDGVYVTHTGCDDIMMKKMMMEKGEIDQNHTGPQVVLVKRIIMKHDSPVRITYNHTIHINIRLSVTLHTCARTER